MTAKEIIRWHKLLEKRVEKVNKKMVDRLHKETLKILKRFTQPREDKK